MLFLYSTNGSGACHVYFYLLKKMNYSLSFSEDYLSLSSIEFVQKVSQYTIILASVFLLAG